MRFSGLIHWLSFWLSCSFVPSPSVFFLETLSSLRPLWSTFPSGQASVGPSCPPAGGGVIPGFSLQPSSYPPIALASALQPLSPSSHPPLWAHLAWALTPGRGSINSQGGWWTHRFEAKGTRASPAKQTCWVSFADSAILALDCGLTVAHWPAVCVAGIPDAHSLPDPHPKHEWLSLSTCSSTHWFCVFITFTIKKKEGGI